MSASSSNTDLRNRIIFTLAILVVYRFGTFVPLPGIDPEQLKIMMEGNQKGLLGMFNVFAGGAVSRMAIFALGIMPYISSSIIVQLLTGVSDYFKNLKSQGETGRAKITQITRYGTVLLATVQGYGLAVGLESSAGLVINPGVFFKISTVTTIVSGTIFLMWLGEQITQRGIGNGISLIIFAGIVAEIPRALVTTFELGRTGAISTVMIIGIFVLLILTIYVWIKFFPKSKIGKSLTLNDVIDESASYAESDLKIGDEGVAISTLRPAGIALINDQRLDVISDSSWVEKNSKIRVIDVQKGHIEVEKI